MTRDEVIRLFNLYDFVLVAGDDDPVALEVNIETVVPHDLYGYDIYQFIKDQGYYVTKFHENDSISIDLVWFFFHKYKDDVESYNSDCKDYDKFSGLTSDIGYEEFWKQVQSDRANWLLTHNEIVHYHNNGNVSKRFYQNNKGEVDGFKVMYDEDGSVKCCGYWRKGKPNGLFNLLYKGTLTCQWNERNGLKHGEELHWNVFGKLIVHCRYENGVMVKNFLKSDED